CTPACAATYHSPRASLGAATEHQRRLRPMNIATRNGRPILPLLRGQNNGDILLFLKPYPTSVDVPVDEGCLQVQASPQFVPPTSASQTDYPGSRSTG